MIGDSRFIANRCSWAPPAPVAVLLAAALGLAGLASCAGGSAGPASTVRAAATAHAVRPVATQLAPGGLAARPPRVAGPSALTPASTVPAPLAARCATDELRLTVGPGQALGRSTYRLPLVLTNAGPDPCTVYGFPGVSLVAADGSTFDLPRARADEPARVELDPGRRALSTLTYQAATGGENVFMPATISVTPPDERNALRTRWIRGWVHDDRSEDDPTTVITAFVPATPAAAPDPARR